MFPWWISVLCVQLLSILSVVSSFGILCIAKSSRYKKDKSKKSAESPPISPESSIRHGLNPNPSSVNLLPDASKPSPTKPVPDSSASKSGVPNPQPPSDPLHSQETQKSMSNSKISIDKTQDSMTRSFERKAFPTRTKVEKQLESIRTTKQMPRRKLSSIEARSLKKSLAMRKVSPCRTREDKQDLRSRKGTSIISKKSMRKRLGSRERTQDTQTLEDAMGTTSNATSQNYAQPPESEDDNTLDGVKSVDKDEVPSDIHGIRGISPNRK
ncbi:hypothetical protein L596_013286 [Steinernema carpocapsae]|uniref:Uncharacterized protein n=1 Tax=Steinernema carpocapsae TaxID=34508 RepID=A0A4U5NZV9_STECR|nr:hypothetical protein L596_013286 [Steinernema carpocapsae]